MLDTYDTVTNIMAWMLIAETLIATGSLIFIVFSSFKFAGEKTTR